MIKENFKDDDIVNQSKRGKAEESLCLRQALSEAFFHGLNLVGFVEAENTKLQKTLTSTKTSSDYYKGLLDGAEKKIEDMQSDNKAELKTIQDELDRVKVEARIVSKAQDKEIERLKAENERLQGNKDLELSQAYFAGFAAYL